MHWCFAFKMYKCFDYKTYAGVMKKQHFLICVASEEPDLLSSA